MDNTAGLYRFLYVKQYCYAYISGNRQNSAHEIYRR